MNNSIKEVILLLRARPHLTENQIMDLCWGFKRKTTGTVARLDGSVKVYIHNNTNKKYSELIRRGLDKGLIARTDISNVGANIRAINGWGKAIYIYHLPTDPYFTDQINCY